MRVANLVFLLATVGCASHSVPEQLEKVWVVQSSDQYGSACPIKHEAGRTWFVTAKHVLGEKMLFVSQPRSGAFFDDIKIEWEHEKSDIALFSVGAIIPLLEMSLEPLEIGETIYIVGYPLGAPLTISQGLAQGDDRVSGSVAPGNSGGAILDSSGRLVGIVSMMFPVPTVYGDSTRWGPIALFESIALLPQQ